MKLPNLSKITKNIKLPKFSINIKTFLMIGLLIFYLVIIISHFSIRIFENFTEPDQSVIMDLSNNIQKNSDVNSKNSLDTYNIMTKLIPDIQKNIIDLSSNLLGIESKIAGIQPSSIQPFDASLNITPIQPIDASLNITPIQPIDASSNVISIQT